METPALQVERLVKNFGRTRILDGISFEIPKGKVVGLLGPNGAGKTTTIHILLGITLPDEGSVKYFGKELKDNRRSSLQRMNFSSSFNTLQGRITVRENLLVFAHLYEVRNPQKKIAELARAFEIEKLMNQRFWDLSSGQKTRVNLAKSLINDPDVLLLDEPTASLDPDIADKVLSFIEQLRRERDISILYTSHDTEEVARICDEVIFLDKGAVVAKDTPLGLTRRVRKAQLQLAFAGQRHEMESYLTGNNLSFSFLQDFMVRIELEEKDIAKTISEASALGLEITDIEVHKPTLEDIFLHIARGTYVA